MALFKPSDLNIYFLDEQGRAPGESSFPSSGTYATYRSALLWRYWNFRNTGIPGDNSTFGDSIIPTNDTTYINPNTNPSNSIYGSSITMLRGMYQYSASGNVIGNGYHDQDFILDNNDALLTGKPKWQYTWFAIHNSNTESSVYRVAIRDAQGTQQLAGYTNNHTVNAESFVSARMIGKIAAGGNGINALNNFKNSNSQFPHIVTLSGNTWNALGQACTVRHRYNNSSSYSLSNGHNPWQVVRWMHIGDPDPSVPHRTQHCFDIGPDEILLGVLVVSRDSTVDKEGDGPISMSDMGGFYGWKIWQIPIEFDYLVIS